VVIREASQALFIAISTRSTSNAARSYTASVRMFRGVGLPGARPQVVVLNFQGASNVSISGRPAINVPAFDAGRIDGRYAAFTNVIINNVYQMVAEDYAGLGVEIYLAGDPTIPAGR